MKDTRARIEVREPGQFGHVAVLMGGESAEREISLMSGKAVLEALRSRGIDALAVDATGDLPRTLLDGGYDRVWNALHGPGGEDGTVQGLLECLRIPYTGSGVMASALGMDKLRSKRLFSAQGLLTPEFRVIAGPEEFSGVLSQLGLPLAVKPNAQGSSVGITRVGSANELEAAWVEAARFGREVLVERWIEGAEYSASVLHGEILPLIRIEAASGFYDYHAKYFSEETRYICPSGLAEEVEGAYAAQSMLAFEAIGGSGWGRVDFMVDADGRALFLEVNTVPGMTTHSLVPMAARVRGIDFAELCWRVLETSFREKGPQG